MTKRKRNQPLTIDHQPLIILFLLVLLLFVFPVFLGKIPIPADTILGMYHPWRDKVWDGLARVPFKNFLITDPVRQQFPWKNLAISLIKSGKPPLWSPYTFSGTPLLANLQSAPFYPLNFLFFLLPFKTAWTFFIVLQQILAGIFLYFYLCHFNLKKPACLLGSLAWVFSGFFIAWWEWGNIIHVGLWLPLILLSIDKIIEHFNNWKSSKLKAHPEPVHLRRTVHGSPKPSSALVYGQNSKLQLKTKNLFAWSTIFVFSLVFSFFAGHLQTSFYLVLISLFYLAGRLLQVKQNRRKLLSLFIIHYSLFILVTAIQWLPTLEFIRYSARDFDQADFTREGWFIPWQHLIQFLAPDFFGNPTTLNYWGKWNYAEFLGYIGIIPLIFSLLAIFFRKDKKTLFFSILVLVSLVLALPTPLAKLPYKLRIPFLSTSQPTRLIFVVDFSLAVLVALGFDWLLKCAPMNQFINTELILKAGVVILSVGLVVGGLWVFVFSAPKLWTQASWLANLFVSKRNLILPTALFLASCAIFTVFVISLRVKRLRRILLFAVRCSLFAVVAFDLLRFAKKFTPFVKSDWLFPTTEAVEFLKNDPEVFRLMTTDRRIFPPNFSIFYRLQTVEGYDPLYLKNYGQLVAAWERGKPDISPFSFNRIIRPGSFDSRIADLLNVKYVLSLSDIDSEKLELVFREGETRVYKNRNAFPRAFWVGEAKVVEKDQEAIDLLFDPEVDLRKTVIIEDQRSEVRGQREKEEKGRAEVLDYQENRVVVETESDQDGFVVLTDSFYPGWRAEIDGEETEILQANFTFRAIKVPAGRHRAVFSYRPWSFKIGLLLSLIGAMGTVILNRRVKTLLMVKA